MSKPEHVALLHRGVDAWNEARPEWPDLAGEDLSGLDLTGIALAGATIVDAKLCNARLDQASLQGAILSGSDLRGASLRRSNLYFARLLKTDLSDCCFEGASLVGATLDGARMVRASFEGANLQNVRLSMADASECDFSGASLVSASLVKTNMSKANFSRSELGGACLVRCVVEGAVFDDAFVYGMGAWDLIGKPSSSENLCIAAGTSVTVTDLRVAQFMYLMLTNEEIRTILDAVTSKAVLILGRFSSDRKPALNLLRTEMRNRGFVPIIFDFEAAIARDITETVGLLARMARFVFAEVTDQRSIPQELYAIAPHVELPIQPLVVDSEEPYPMLADLRKYPWVLPTRKYRDLDDLRGHLPQLLAAIEQSRQGILARRQALDA